MLTVNYHTPKKNLLARAGVIATLLLALGLGLVVSTSPVLAQSNQESLFLASGNPARPTNITGGVTWAGGIVTPPLTTYYYWVVAVYQGGSVVGVGPVKVANAPVTTTAGNFVTISWTGVPGTGVTYDVLRTTFSAWPGGAVTCAACLVHTGLTATTTTDTGAPALRYYTLAAFNYPHALSSVSSNNREFSTPALELNAPTSGTVRINSDTYVTGKVITSDALRVGDVLYLTNVPGNVNSELWGGDTEITDPSLLAGESLTNGAFTAPGAEWVAAGGWVLGGTSAVYSHNAGPNTLTQPNAQLATAGVPYRWYQLKYDVTAKTRCVSCVLSVTATFAGSVVTVDTKLGTNKLMYFKAAPGAATAAVIFNVTGSVATDSLTLDNVSLKQVIGGNLIVNGTITGGGPYGLTIDSSGNVSTPGGISATSGNMTVGSLAGESLTNGALTSGTSWSRTGDFALGANVATYTDATHTGSITQAAVDQAIAGVGSKWYRFQYDVVSNTMVGGTVTITNAYATSAYQLNMAIGTGKVAYIYTAAAPAAFIINVAGSSAGAFVLDNLSLKQVLGGDLIVYDKITGGGTNGIRIDSNGDVRFDAAVVNGLPLKGMPFSYLGVWAPAAGTLTYCTDCDPAIAGAGPTVCSSSGTKTGTLAIRLNSAWTCLGI